MNLNVNQTLSDGSEWLDIFNPSQKELIDLAKKYNLHPVQVQDCLQPGHLPKHEVSEEYAFMIIRTFQDVKDKNVFSFQQLTHKIAVFYNDKFIITVHQYEQAILDVLAEKNKEKAFNGTMDLLNKLISSSFNTYQTPLMELATEVDYFEGVIFVKKSNKSHILQGLYQLKRKVDLIKRMFELSLDIVEVLDSKKHNVHTRDTRDLFIKIQHQARYLSESTNQLLTIYFSISSQRTNEIMRILTIFSVFFLPLTFIVGVYGMNFTYMPELTWKWSYPVVMGIMALITIILYFWFKRKKWF